MIPRRQGIIDTQLAFFEFNNANITGNSLLVPQRVYRIRMRRSQRLRAHDQQCEDQRDGSCHREDPPCNIGADGITLKIIVHRPPG